MEIEPKLKKYHDKAKVHSLCIQTMNKKSKCIVFTSCSFESSCLMSVNTLPCKKCGIWEKGLLSESELLDMIRKLEKIKNEGIYT